MQDNFEFLISLSLSLSSAIIIPKWWCWVWASQLWCVWPSHSFVSSPGWAHFVLNRSLRVLPLCVSWPNIVLQVDFTTCHGLLFSLMMVLMITGLLLFFTAPFGYVSCWYLNPVNGFGAVIIVLCYNHLKQKHHNLSWFFYLFSFYVCHFNTQKGAYLFIWKKKGNVFKYIFCRYFTLLMLTKTSFIS